MNEDQPIKCQFCLRQIKSIRIAVEITKKIEQSFYRLTNSKLKKFQTISPFICKRCVKDLESSLGFQQKIIANQRRLVKFESDDTIPVKEEAVKTEELEIVEIKTECFEFEPSAVSQTWLEPPKVEVTEPEIEFKQEDVPEGSPASANSDEDFEKDIPEDDSSDSSDLLEELSDHEEKPLKKKAPKETSKTRVCPYCAGVFSRAGITGHIEKHENEMNGKTIKCKYCDFDNVSRHVVGEHVRLKHPEKHKTRQLYTVDGVVYTDQQRREIIIDAYLANPQENFSALARKLQLSRTTVSKTVERYKERNSTQRKVRTGNWKPCNKVMHDKIAQSYTSHPEWSDRFRAKTLGVSTGTVRRVRTTIGFERENPRVDESKQIYKCKHCPKKYAHNQTLWTHVQNKHKKKIEPTVE